MRKNGDNSKRRANGTGTLRKIGKNYYALFYVRDEETGKRKRMCRATGTSNLETARRELNRLVADFNLKGAAVNPKTAETEKAIEAREDFNSRIEEARNSTAFMRQQLEAERQRVEDEKREREEQRIAEEKDRAAIEVKSAFVYYVASKKRPDSSERTLTCYESQYGRFARWMEANHPKIVKIRDVTPALADEYMEWLANNVSRATRNQHLTLLRLVWRVLRWNENAQLSVDPFEAVRPLKARRDIVPHREITIEELRRTIQVIADPKHRELFTIRKQSAWADASDISGELIGLFYVGVYTALRLTDCLMLSFDGGIDLDAGTITVTPRKTAVHGWTITIPIHPTLRARLEKIPRDGRKGFLFPTLAEVAERDPSAVSKKIQAAFRLAGLETLVDAPAISGGTRRRVSVGFHSIRHFYISLLSNSGVNQELVNYLTSHNQGTVTARYFHDHLDALQRAVALLPSLDGEERKIDYSDTSFAKIRKLLDNADAGTLQAVREYIGTLKR